MKGEIRLVFGWFLVAEKRYHKYYKWVPMMLFLHGVLFYVPHWFWKSLEQGKVRNLTEGMRGLAVVVRSDAAAERKAQATGLADYVYQTLHTNRLLGYCYVFCQVLNLMNVVANILFIDWFMNGTFLQYGPRVLRFSFTDQFQRTDPMLEVSQFIALSLFISSNPKFIILNQEIIH